MVRNEDEDCYVWILVGGENEELGFAGEML